MREIGELMGMGGGEMRRGTNHMNTDTRERKRNVDIFIDFARVEVLSHVEERRQSS
jgi:hypothetical protein